MNNLEGRCFGPLEVVCRAGSQSGNVCWIYWCRACDHHGHRLGTTLRRSGRKTRCPKCGAGYSFQNKFEDFDPDKVLRAQAAFKETDAKPRSPLRRGFAVKLRKCSEEDLGWLEEKIQRERARRSGEA